jgi:hypothetical protein
MHVCNLSPYVGFQLQDLKRLLVNPLNAELNPTRHLLALVGARHIVHVGRIRVKHWPRLKTAGHRVQPRYDDFSLCEPHIRQILCYKFLTVNRNITFHDYNTRI